MKKRTVDGLGGKVELTGRDDRYSAAMGPYHVHRCERCAGEMACYNGPTCDDPASNGYCTQACYDFKTPAYSRTGQPAGD